MGITVALTGSSGNMGRETLPALLSLPFVDKIKLLYLNNNKERKFARKIKKKYGDRVEQIFGDVANYSDCESLVKDADYVVNLAAVIPPDSDHAHELTRACNVTGVQNLVKAVESMQKQPKLPVGRTATNLDVCIWRTNSLTPSLPSAMTMFPARKRHYRP